MHSGWVSGLPTAAAQQQAALAWVRAAAAAPIDGWLSLAQIGLCPDSGMTRVATTGPVHANVGIVRVQAEGLGRSHMSRKPGRVASAAAQGATSAWLE